MRIPIPSGYVKFIVMIILLSSAGRAAAQQSAADQSFKTIPQQTKDAAENKATTKTSTVTNGAMNKLDSASNKALKGFTGLFKKKGNGKNKKQKGDSTGIHPTDTVAAPPKTSFQPAMKPSISGITPALCYAMPIQRQPAYCSPTYDPCCIRRPGPKRKTLPVFSSLA